MSWVNPNAVAASAGDTPRDHEVEREEREHRGDPDLECDGQRHEREPRAGPRSDDVTEHGDLREHVARDQQREHTEPQVLAQLSSAAKQLQVVQTDNEEAADEHPRAEVAGREAARQLIGGPDHVGAVGDATAIGP